MRKFFQIFQLFYVALSIDTVIGVMMCTVFSAKLLSFDVSFSWFLLVAMSTLSIYGLDRIVDVRGGVFPDTVRHAFFYEYGSILCRYFVFILIGALGVVCLFFPLRVVVFNLFLGVFVLVHYVCLSNRSFAYRYASVKDVLVAGIYTGCIWGNLLLMGHHQTDVLMVGVFMSVFFLCVLHNLWIISWIDRHVDLQAMKVTCVTQLTGSQYTLRLLLLFFFILLITLCIVTIYSEVRSFALLLCFVPSVTMFLPIFSKKFSINTLHGVGEMIFWIPGLSVFF